MTLEWLLIVGAIAGIAAVSVLAVQRAIDDSADLPGRPDIRVVDAEIAAAMVADEATAIVRDNPGNFPNYLLNDEPGFVIRCDEIATSYSDVVQPPPALWRTPTTTPGPPPALDEPAKCTLTRL